MSSCPKPKLRLDWCSHEAATYAVMHWHYSRKMPVGKLAKIGAWEGDRFIGALIYGLGGGGACNGKQYGLARNFEMAELQRIALMAHETPVSRMIAISVKMLAAFCPGLRLLISYADPKESHHGGIYQAAGWVYTGKSPDDWQAVWPDGRVAHSRIARRHVQFGVMKTVDISGASRVPVLGKHRYLWPLDPEMRATIAPLAQPYPKRVRSSENAAPSPLGEGGVIPTRTLHPIATP